MGGAQQSELDFSVRAECAAFDFGEQSLLGLFIHLPFLGPLTSHVDTLCTQPVEALLLGGIFQILKPCRREMGGRGS